MYLTKKEAAERLRISVRTLEGLIGDGQIPAYRIGRTMVRIDEADLAGYLSSRKIPVKTRAKTAEPEPEAPVRRPCLYVPGMKVV